MGRNTHTEIPNGTVRYEKSYSTALIKDAMNNSAYREGGRKEMWVTRRTLPVYASASGIGGQCKYATTENVGFDESTLQLVNHERAMHAYTYLCDAQWDTIPADYARTDSRMFVHQSLWLLNDDEHSYERAEAVIPDYFRMENRFASPKMPSNEDRALRPDERIKFCEWLAPYAERPTNGKP